MNPSLKGSGYPNPGWPGCCRPPNVSENTFIPPADWQAVTIVHRVPVPAVIRDLLAMMPTMMPAMASGAAPQAPVRERGGSQSQSSPRKDSASLTPPKAPVALVKQPAPLAIPAVKATKARSDSSPKQPSAALSRDQQRASLDQPRSAGAANGSPTVPPSDIRRTVAISPREHSPGSKPASLRKVAGDQDSPGSKHASLRKAVEQDSTLRRATKEKRAPTASSIALSLSQATLEDRPSMKRRTSANDGAKSQSPPSTRLVDVMNTPVVVATRTPKKSTSQENLRSRRTASDVTPVRVVPKIAIPSGKSDGSSSSSALSESTVTSEGFTDYLSDESEAEIQKQVSLTLALMPPVLLTTFPCQAELKAAQVAQNIHEENEFKAARKQLVTVGLAPPKSWHSSTVGRHAGKDVYGGNDYRSRNQLNIMEVTRSK